MSKRIRGITIEIGGDTTKLGDALKGVDKQAKGIASELREVEKLLKLDPRNVNLLAQRKQLLAEAVKTSTERLQTLKEAQRQAEQAFREGKIGEDQYRAIQREVISATAELEGLEKQLIEVNNRFKHAGEGIKKFGDRTQELGGKLTPVSAAAGGAIAGIVGLAVKAGQTADDLNTLSKQTGLTTDTLQRFRFASDIIDVSMETMTGALTKLTRTMGNAQPVNKEAAASFSVLGVTITDELTGKVRDSERAFHDVVAALKGVDDEATRNAMSLQLLGLSTKDLAPLLNEGTHLMSKLSEQMAAAQGGSKATAAAFKTLGVRVLDKHGRLKDSEVVFHDIVAALGGVTDEAKRNELAMKLLGTSAASLTPLIRNGQLALETLSAEMKGASGGNDRLEAAFKRLGVTLKDEMGKLRDNEVVFQEVITALGKIENETERNILAMELMGKSAQDLNPLILGGADALKKMGDEAAAAGMILDQETLDGLNEFNDVLDSTKAQLAATGTAVGATFGAVLLPMVQDLAKSVQDLAAWFRGLDQDTAKMILVFLAMVAALAPLLIIIGKVITAIGAITTAIGALKAAAALAKVTVGAFIAVKVLLAAKILAIIAVVGLLVAAVHTLISRWDDVKAFFAGLWTSVRNTFSSAVSGLLGVVQSLWDGAVGRFQSMIGRIREIVAGVTEAIAAPFRRAREIVGDITTTIGNFLQRLNPFARQSPSLVDNVAAGVKAIQREYGRLEQLKLPSLTATMTPAPAAAVAAPAPAQLTHQGPLFVVQGLTVRTEADIEKISRELYRHIQAASRARGG